MDQVQKVYNVYRYFPDRDRHQLLGSVLESGGEMDVLADYFGYLRPLDDPQRGRALWAQLERNPYFRVIDREELRQGHHPDLLAETQGPTAAERPEPKSKRDPIWEYTHPILGTGPQILEAREGQILLNGQALPHAQAGKLLEYLRTGQASIRYRKTPLEKMAKHLESLSKIEPKLSGALDSLRAAVKAGHVHPDVLKALSQEIFVDPMVPNIGNKKAYNDFASRPRGGVHLFLDGNDFGSINKMHSHEHGDQAIVSMGQAMREAMDETVGRGNGKLFRYGGDEFRAHVPTLQHAAEFSRALRAKLEALPPVGGTHQLSVSAGFGATPEHAEAAANHAKSAKKAAGYPLGQAKMHVHSLVPGAEGSVPVDPGHVPLVPAPKLAPSAFPAEGPEGEASGGQAPSTPSPVVPK